MVNKYETLQQVIISAYVAAIYLQMTIMLINIMMQEKNYDRPEI